MILMASSGITNRNKRIINQAINDGQYMRHLVDKVSAYLNDLRNGTKFHPWTVLPDTEIQAYQVALTLYEVRRLAGRYPGLEAAEKLKSDAESHAGEVERKLGLRLPDATPRKVE